MFELLKHATGYTEGKGMFYKNLDQEGTFDGDSSAPAGPEKKLKQFDLMADQSLRIDLENTAEKDAEAGREPNFAKWVARWRLQDADEKSLKKSQGVYDQHYTAQAAEMQHFVESYFGSFHEAEKRHMKEEQALMESEGKAGGSQWEITRTGMASLRKVMNVEYYGELDLSNKNIKAVAEIYTEKLRGDMMLLLETTKSFTENVGKYFTADRRKTAMNANRQAQTEGEEVVELLKKTPVKKSKEN